MNDTVWMTKDNYEWYRSGMGMTLWMTHYEWQNVTIMNDKMSQLWKTIGQNYEWQKGHNYEWHKGHNSAFLWLFSDYEWHYEQQ